MSNNDNIIDLRRKRTQDKQTKKVHNNDNLNKAYDIVFNTEAGNMVLNDIFKFVEFDKHNSPVSSAGLDINMMIFNEGMRSLYMRIRRNINPETVYIAENLKLSNEAE